MGSGGSGHMLSVVCHYILSASFKDMEASLRPHITQASDIWRLVFVPLPLPNLHTFKIMTWLMNNQGNTEMVIELIMKMIGYGNTSTSYSHIFLVSLPCTGSKLLSAYLGLAHCTSCGTLYEDNWPSHLQQA